MPNIKQTIHDDIVAKHRNLLGKNVENLADVKPEEQTILDGTKNIELESFDEDIKESRATISTKTKEMTSKSKVIDPLVRAERDKVKDAAKTELTKQIEEEIKNKEALLKPHQTELRRLEALDKTSYDTALKKEIDALFSPDKDVIRALQNMPAKHDAADSKKAMDVKVNLLTKHPEEFDLTYEDKQLQLALRDLKGDTSDEKINGLRNRVGGDLSNPVGSAHNIGVITAINDLDDGKVSKILGTKDKKIAKIITVLEKDEITEGKLRDNASVNAILDAVLGTRPFSKDLLKTELTRFLKVNEVTGIHVDDQAAIDAINAVGIASNRAIENTIGHVGYGVLANDQEKSLIGFKFRAAGAEALNLVNTKLKEPEDITFKRTEVEQRLRALRKRNGEDLSVNIDDEDAFYKNAVIHSGNPSQITACLDGEEERKKNMMKRDKTKYAAGVKAYEDLEEEYIKKCTTKRSDHNAASLKYKAANKKEMEGLESDIKAAKDSKAIVTDDKNIEKKARREIYNIILADTPKEDEKKALTSSFLANEKSKEEEDKAMGLNAALSTAGKKAAEIAKELNETRKLIATLKEEASLYLEEEKKYLIKKAVETSPANKDVADEYVGLLDGIKAEKLNLKDLQAKRAKFDAKNVEKEGYSESRARVAGIDMLCGDVAKEGEAVKTLVDLGVNFDKAAFEEVKKAIGISLNGSKTSERVQEKMVETFKKIDLHLSGKNSEKDEANPVLAAFYQELYHRNVFQELPREEKKNFYKMAALNDVDAGGGEIDERANADLIAKFDPKSWRSKLLKANTALIKEERANERAVLEEVDPIAPKAKEPSYYEKLAKEINGREIRDPDALYREYIGKVPEAVKKEDHEKLIAKIFGDETKKDTWISSPKYQANRLTTFTALLEESWAAAIEAAKDTTDATKQRDSEDLIKKLDDGFLKDVSSPESKKFYNKIFAEFVWERTKPATRDDLMAKYEHYTDAGSKDVKDGLDNGTPVANKMLRHFFELQVPMAKGGGIPAGLPDEIDTSLLEEEFNKRRAAELAEMKAKMKADMAAEDAEIEEEAKRAKSSGAKGAKAGKMSKDDAARTVQRNWRKKGSTSEDGEETDRDDDSQSEGQSGGRDTRGSGKGSRGDDDSDQSTKPNLGGKSGSRGLNLDDATLQGIIGELANIRNSIGAIEHRLGLPSAGPSTRPPYNMDQGFNYQGPNAPHFQQQQYQGGGVGYYQGQSPFQQQHFNGGNNQFNYGPPPFAAGGPQQWGQAGMPSNGPNQEVEQLKRQLEATTAKLEALAGGKSADSKGQSDGNVGGNSGANASSSEAAKKSMPTNTMSGDVDIDEAIKYLKGSKKPSSMIPQIIGSSEESVDGEKGRRGSAKILDNGLVVVQYNSADEFNEHIAKARGNFRRGESLTGSKHESLISLVEINVDGETQYKVVKSDFKGIKVHQIDEDKYRELIDEKKLKKPILQSAGEDSRAPTRDALMQNIALEFSGERVSLNKQMKDDLLKQCENEKVFGIRVPGRWGGRKDKLKGAMKDASFSISDRHETVIERDHNNKNRVTVTINGKSDEDAMVSIGNGCYIKVMAKDTTMPDGTEVKAGKAAPDRIYMDGHPDGIDISGGMFRLSLAKSGNLVDALTVDGDKRGAQDRAEEIMKRYNELQLIVCKNAPDSASISFMVDGKTHGMKLEDGERIALVVAAAGVTAALGVATAGIAPAAIIGATAGIAGMTTLTGLTTAGGVATVVRAADVYDNGSVGKLVDKIFPSNSPKLKEFAHLSEVSSSKSKFYEKFEESSSSR